MPRKSCCMAKNWLGTLVKGVKKCIHSMEQGNVRVEKRC